MQLYIMQQFNSKFVICNPKNDIFCIINFVVRLQCENSTDTSLLESLIAKY